MNLRENVGGGWLKFKNWAASDIPEDPRICERQLINASMAVGMGIGVTLDRLLSGEWALIGNPILLGIAVYAACRLMALSSFGYRFIDTLLNQSTPPGVPTIARAAKRTSDLGKKQ